MIVILPDCVIANGTNLRATPTEQRILSRLLSDIPVNVKETGSLTVQVHRLNKKLAEAGEQQRIGSLKWRGTYELEPRA